MEIFLFLLQQSLVAADLQLVWMRLKNLFYHSVPVESRVERYSLEVK